MPCLFCAMKTIMCTLTFNKAYLIFFVLFAVLQIVAMFFSSLYRVLLRLYLFPNNIFLFVSNIIFCNENLILFFFS